MGNKSLVIVESPTKARTISKFLGTDYIVQASNGHVRDLPNSAAEIPAKYKKEPWARLGVNIENDFEPLYVVPPEKKENLKRLKEALKQAAAVYLATDEDREGESISWHLLESLQPKVPFKRLVFHEITKEAINTALSSPRSIDENLVRAQETRRIVDRLYGYEVSPLLWKKMLPRLSAGRVQSVAIRLLVERERERMRFQKANYWGLRGLFSKTSADGVQFEAELTHLGDKRVATGKDFSPETGRLFKPQDIVLLDQPAAAALREKLLAGTPVVEEIEEKPYTTRPAPPFVTSTLQQEANRKLKLSAKRTMQIAQQLYENGFITYMRTDSTTLSEQALTAARSFISREYGKDYLPDHARRYATQVKNAQEAHEAIRPAGDSFTPPEVVKNQLGVDAFRLYDLIWKRTVASQMQDARGTYVSVFIRADEAAFRASGKTVEFPGFLRAYVEGSDDPEAELADQERLLPKLVKGEKLKVNSLDAQERSTQPPPRYTEGSLIKELEGRGIGRPSTWAAVVELVLSRSYAFKKGNALVPTFIACAVVRLLEKHFANLLNYDFTARLEDDLDAISRGEADSLSYLREFYQGNGHPGLKVLVETAEREVDPRDVCGIPIGSLSEGKMVEVRIGRFGPFISDGERRASVPEGMAPDELSVEVADNLLTSSGKASEAIGLFPDTNEPIFLKTGRFGPYLQLGEGADGVKPKMASLLPNMKPEDLTLEQAIKLLRLPRVVGKNPRNDAEITAANGKFGPYISCAGESRSIPLDQYSPLDISLEDALALLDTPKSGRRTAKPQVLRELGKHPLTEAPLQLKSGRYGPYVTDGKLNASLPRGADPAALTVDEAVALLEARAAKIASDEAAGITKPKKGGAKKTKSSAAAKSVKKGAKAKTPAKARKPAGKSA